MDWLGIALDEAGERVIASRRIELPLQQVPDVLSEKTGNTGRLLRRSMVTRDRDRMWLVSAQAPEPVYRKLAEAFLFSVSSFELLNPELVPYAENLDEYADRSPFSMGFHYPASWRSRKLPLKEKEAQRVVIETLDKDQRAGSVLTRTWLGTGLADEEILAAYCGGLEAAGWSPARTGWRKTERRFAGNAILYADIRGTEGGKRLDLTAAL